MTSTYKTSGKLTNPVSDLQAARAYLDEPMVEYVKYSDLPDPSVVHDIKWDLTDEESWVVTIITTRFLTATESEKLSEWISGQNSDGLGEGFEQQPFAEHEDSYGGIYDDEDEEAEYSMSSFDWVDNPCKLEFVR